LGGHSPALLRALVALQRSRVGLLPKGQKAPSPWEPFDYMQCRHDVTRTCGHVAEQDDKEILACLQANAKAISRGCHKLLHSYGHVPK
jgi:hypothetical protein